MLKVAQYAAQLEDYDKAIQIYEQVSVTANRVELFVVEMSWWLEYNLENVRHHTYLPVFLSVICKWLNVFDKAQDIYRVGVDPTNNFTSKFNKINPNNVQYKMLTRSTVEKYKEILLWNVEIHTKNEQRHWFM